MVTGPLLDDDPATWPESDGAPVAETFRNFMQMASLVFTCTALLAPRERFHVGGNQFIYYNPHNRREHIAPDVFVLLDVPPGARQKVLVWEEGKFPDVVFEISSPSTIKEDLGAKRRLYGQLGAQEYYIFDPEGAMRPAFQGYVLVGERLEPLAPLAAGSMVSALLGAELRVVEGWLRVIDPGIGEPIPVPDELWARWQAAEEQARQARTQARQARTQARQARTQAAREARARQEAEAQAAREAAARREAEAQAAREARARQAAEERAAGETQARQAAEERDRQAQVDLADLRAQLAGLRAERAVDQ